MKILLLLVAFATPAVAQETLTLTTQETQTIANVWQVRAITIDADAPNIEVTLKSDTGFTFVWRYVVCDGSPCPIGTGTLAQVNGAIRTINRGEFQTKLGMSLNRWILDRMDFLKVKIGTVGGTTP